jgi:DNA-binding NarL/FixJ family response regulator
MARQQELLAVARRFISELEDFCALLEGQDHVTVTGRVGAVGAISRTAPAGLSPRQSEVARMLAEGWSNSEVAATLHISPSTARRHTSAVLTKLAVISRQEVRHVWCLSRDSPRRAPTD